MNEGGSSKSVTLGRWRSATRDKAGGWPAKPGDPLSALQPGQAETGNLLQRPRPATANRWLAATSRLQHSRGFTALDPGPDASWTRILGRSRLCREGSEPYYYVHPSILSCPLGAVPRGIAAFGDPLTAPAQGCGPPPSLIGESVRRQARRQGWPGRPSLMSCAALIRRRESCFWHEAPWAPLSIHPPFREIYFLTHIWICCAELARKVGRCLVEGMSDDGDDCLLSCHQPSNSTQLPPPISGH